MGLQISLGQNDNKKKRNRKKYFAWAFSNNQDSFYLEGDHFKALDLKNDPFTW